MKRFFWKYGAVFVWGALLALYVSLLGYFLVVPSRSQAQNAYLNSWVYQEARDMVVINPPLTVYAVPIPLKHAPALDSTGNPIYPVLVFIGGANTGDTLANPLDYKLTGNAIQFAPNPINPPRADELGATEVQVVYWWGQ